MRSLRCLHILSKSMKQLWIGTHPSAGRFSMGTFGNMSAHPCGRRLAVRILLSILRLWLCLWAQLTPAVGFRTLAHSSPQMPYCFETPRVMSSKGNLSLDHQLSVGRPVSLGWRAPCSLGPEANDKELQQRLTVDNQAVINSSSSLCLTVQYGPPSVDPPNVHGR
jgi:hypothetical protein